MGELICLNDQARKWHENHEAGSQSRRTVPLGTGLRLATAEAIGTSETDISPEVWTIIEDIARDPDLVACVELQQLGYTEVDMSEERLAAIEEIGPRGVREDILGTTKIGEGNFAVALAMCEETVREKYGLDEQPLHNSW